MPSRSLRRLLNRTVTLTRRGQTGETGGGQAIYTDTEVGLLAARIELAGLGGRSIPATEVLGDGNEAIVADYHALASLTLEPDEDGTRAPANLSNGDALAGDDGVYEILAVATADGRSAAHHYECKLRKVTP